LVDNSFSSHSFDKAINYIPIICEFNLFLQAIADNGYFLLKIRFYMSIEYSGFGLIYIGNEGWITKCMNYDVCDLSLNTQC